MLLLRLEWAVILALLLGVFSCGNWSSTSQSEPGALRTAPPAGGGNAFDSGHSRAPSVAPRIDCRDSVDWQSVEDEAGERITVRGRVIGARQAASGPVILEVGTPAPGGPGIDIVIPESRRDAFPAPPDVTYDGEIVCVRDVVAVVDGRPTIVANGPDDIYVVHGTDALPSAPPPPAR